MPHALTAWLGDQRVRRRLLQGAGVAFVSLSFLFIGLRLTDDPPWRDHPGLWAHLILPVAGGAVIYGLCGFLLSAAWTRLLGDGAAGIAAPALHRLYGQTQIGKYLPGNVFHLAGRHVAGRRLGLPATRLVHAAFLEAAGLSVVAGLIALPRLASAWTMLSSPAFPKAGAFAVLVAIMVAGGAMALRSETVRCLRQRLSDALRASANAGGGRSGRQLLCALLLYAAFFSITGAILFPLLCCLDREGAPTLSTIAPMIGSCISSFALAWIAGFVTPGASAGLGVREAVLVMALEGTVGAAEAATAALALRLVTTLGDGLFFVIALILPPSPKAAGR